MQFFQGPINWERLSAARAQLDWEVKRVAKYVGKDIYNDEIKPTDFQVIIRDRKVDSPNTLGEYHLPSRTITIYYESIYDYTLRCGGGREEYEWRLAETLAHEVRHYWQHITGYMKKHYEDTLHMPYWDRQIEIDAREFGAWYVKRFSPIVIAPLKRPQEMFTTAASEC